MVKDEVVKSGSVHDRFSRYPRGVSPIQHSDWLVCVTWCEDCFVIGWFVSRGVNTARVIEVTSQCISTAVTRLIPTITQRIVVTTGIRW